MRDDRPAYRCALCGEFKPRVRRLISGPHAGAMICQECVERLGIEPMAAADEDAGAPGDTEKEPRPRDS